MSIRKVRETKCLYNQKSVKGIKINVHTVLKFSIMNKVLTERFSQDPLENWSLNR